MHILENIREILSFGTMKGGAYISVTGMDNRDKPNEFVMLY